MGLIAYEDLREQESLNENDNRFRGDYFEFVIALKYFYEICYDVSKIEQTFEKGYDMVVNAKKYEIKGIRDITAGRLQRFVLRGEQLCELVDYYMFIIESAATGAFSIRILTYKQVLDLVNFRADNVQNSYLVTISQLLKYHVQARANINGGVSFFHILPPPKEVSL